MNHKEKKTIIFLTGFMGSGKSTVGPILANTMGYKFIDLDLLIEEREHRKISEIFAAEGEQKFRYLERESLKEILFNKFTIISLGGGTVTNNETLELIKHHGVMVYLKSDAEHIFQRLRTKSDRPMLRDDNGQLLDGADLKKKSTDYYQLANSFINKPILSLQRTTNESASQLMNLQKNFLPTLTNKYHIVNVALADRSYPIVIGSNLLNTIGKLCVRHKITRTVVIITDANVARHYLSIVKKSLEKKKFKVHTFILQPGERQKSLHTAEKIYTKLLEWNIERQSTIIALGGGVVGDLAGFIAATYQRGIGFIQIPTSLLAQVDSSVGGKVGINHPLAKNMIGAFYQPQFVLADTSVLKTLPKRELICGMGEVVKYGIILDEKFFSFIERNLIKALSGEKKVLSHIIRRSCELKAYVVSRDEKEQNLRAILNFGHTIGHAIERAGKYSSLKHGEAILYGMIAEAHISVDSGMVSFADVDRMEQLIQRIPIPSLSSLQLRNKGLLETMRKDKKVMHGVIRMTLLHSIGKISLPLNVDEQMINRAIDYVKLYGV